MADFREVRGKTDTNEMRLDAFDNRFDLMEAQLTHQLTQIHIAQLPEARRQVVLTGIAGKNRAEMVPFMALTGAL